MTVYRFDDPAALNISLLDVRLLWWNEEEYEVRD